MVFGLVWVIGSGLVGGLLGAIATGVTAVGSFLTIYVHFYLGLLLTKGPRNFLDLIARYGDEVLIDSAILVIVGGLTLGIPQAIVLRETSISWSAWVTATMLGVLAAWLWYLGLATTSIVDDLPRQIVMVPLTSGYWIALTIPQAFLIGRAMRDYVQTRPL